MPKIDLTQLNYLAIIVAGFATFMLGGVWYTALFGKLWQQLQGITDEQKQEIQKRRPPAVFFGGMFACYLVVSFAVAAVFSSLGVTTAAGGALFGLLLWVGPTAAVGMTGHIASGKPMGVFYIDASFQLIFMVMIGAILGVWR